jgi:hypothetical protein
MVVRLDDDEDIRVPAIEDVRAGSDHPPAHRRTDLDGGIAHDVGCSVGAGLAVPRLERDGGNDRRERLERSGAVVIGLVEPDALDPRRRMPQRDTSDRGEGRVWLCRHDPLRCGRCRRSCRDRRRRRRRRDRRCRRVHIGRALRRGVGTRGGQERRGEQHRSSDHRPNISAVTGAERPRGVPCFHPPGEASRQTTGWRFGASVEGRAAETNAPGQGWFL